MIFSIFRPCLYVALNWCQATSKAEKVTDHIKYQYVENFIFLSAPLVSDTYFKETRPMCFPKCQTIPLKEVREGWCGKSDQVFGFCNECFGSY